MDIFLYAMGDLEQCAKQYIDPQEYPNDGHCIHWEDGYGPCCRCGARGMTREEMLAQGMEP